MCGITAGIIKKRENSFWDLLVTSEIRGQDGTGIAKIEKDSISIIETHSNKKASDLEVQEVKEGDIVIGQNRLATFGLDERNNQPLVTDRFALVHNGNLYNFEQLFKELNLKREYQVDTELILRFIENADIDSEEGYSKVITKVFEEISGNMACILLDLKLRKLIAFCKYKPLLKYEDETGLYLFSTENIGKKVFGDKEFTELGNNSYIIL